MNKTWTLKEESLLEKEYRRGASYNQIIDALGGKKSWDSIATKIARMGLVRKYQALVKNKRLGHFDIETSGLNANFGFLISWSIKSDDLNVRDPGVLECDKLTRTDFEKAGYDDPDKRIVKSMVDTLNEYDVITYHFGGYFDGPFARTRALLYNLPFPQYGQVVQIDTWRLARNLLKLHSNRLEAVAEYLGVSTKTHLNPAIWRRATRGSIRDVNYILEHNKQDVITLEKVYNRLKEYTPGVRKSL